MSGFLEMGGYAAYVWPAYGITLLVLVLNVWSARRMRQQNLDRARRLAGSEDAATQPTVRRL
ncbi:heme exporter protein CcmD [Candidatus Rariloculus sp.]|uniref:heme exporter protein CcmD n=1 Tax=Candidatus Rariloculus sp. TaxID=3101265 RepID=UPI003D132BC2